MPVVLAYQQRDALHLAVRVAQPQQDLARHLLAEELVLVEGVLAPGLRRLRAARLSDVVQQRRQTDGEVAGREVHRPQRVPEHVVRVVLVLLEAHALQELGDDAREEACSPQQPDAAAGGIAAHEQLAQLLAHAFPSNLGEDVERLRDCPLRLPVQREPQRAGEADRP